MCIPTLIFLLMLQIARSSSHHASPLLRHSVTLPPSPPHSHTHPHPHTPDLDLSHWPAYKKHTRHVSETPSLPPFHSSSTSSAYHSRNSSLGSQLSSCCFESDSVLNQLTDMDSALAVHTGMHVYVCVCGLGGGFVSPHTFCGRVQLYSRRWGGKYISRERMCYCRAALEHLPTIICLKFKPFPLCAKIPYTEWLVHLWTIVSFPVRLWNVVGSNVCVYMQGAMETWRDSIGMETPLLAAVTSVSPPILAHITSPLPYSTIGIYMPLWKGSKQS